MILSINKQIQDFEFLFIFFLDLIGYDLHTLTEHYKSIEILLSSIRHIFQLFSNVTPTIYFLLLIMLYLQFFFNVFNI